VVERHSRSTTPHTDFRFHHSSLGSQLVTGVLFRSLDDGVGEAFLLGGQNFHLLGGGRQVCVENGGEKERLLRGCAFGFAVY
jgi:hypothetical protein